MGDVVTGETMHRLSAGVALLEERNKQKQKQTAKKKKELAKR